MLDAGGVESGEVQSDRAPDSRPKRSGLVSVRLPVDTDWPKIRALVRQHHARTIFGYLPFSEKKYARIEKDAQTRKQHQCVLVAEARGEIVGVAWFSAGEYLLSDGGVMTTAHLVAVDGECCKPFLAAKVFIRLVRGMVAWSRSVGAGQVLIHVNTGAALKGTDRLLRAGGAKCVGGSYILAE